MSEASPIPLRRYGASGSQVVVLHGGPGVPGYVAPVARHLAARHRVIEPLQRLSGSVRLSVARHVEDLAQVAPAASHIVGASWGGMLALSFASLHPERVQSLCLVGCGTYDPAARMEFQPRTAQRLGRTGCAEITRLQRELDRAETDDARAAWFAKMGALATEAQCFDPLPESEAAVAHDPSGFQETWDDVLRLQRQGIEPERFRAITAPILMLHGAQDPHPGELVRDRLQTVLPALRYVELENCGHEPWRERQAHEAFYRHLDAWLAEMDETPTCS